VGHLAKAALAFDSKLKLFVNIIYLVYSFTLVPQQQSTFSFSPGFNYYFQKRLAGTLSLFVAVHDTVLAWVTCQKLSASKIGKKFTARVLCKIKSRIWGNSDEKRISSRR
jgi:hypothetical protein